MIIAPGISVYYDLGIDPKGFINPRELTRNEEIILEEPVPSLEEAYCGFHETDLETTTEESPSPYRPFAVHLFENAMTQGITSAAKRAADFRDQEIGLTQKALERLTEILEGTGAFEDHAETAHMRISLRKSSVSNS